MIVAKLFDAQGAPEAIVQIPGNSKFHPDVVSYNDKLYMKLSEAPWRLSEPSMLWFRQVIPAEAILITTTEEKKDH